jgi:hypothetical protein
MITEIPVMQKRSFKTCVMIWYPTNMLTISSNNTRKQEAEKTKRETMRNKVLMTAQSCLDCIFNDLHIRKWCFCPNRRASPALRKAARRRPLCDEHPSLFAQGTESGRHVIGTTTFFVRIVVFVVSDEFPTRRAGLLNVPERREHRPSHPAFPSTFNGMVVFINRPCQGVLFPIKSQAGLVLSYT